MSRRSILSIGWVQALGVIAVGGLALVLWAGSPGGEDRAEPSEAPAEADGAESDSAGVIEPGAGPAPPPNPGDAIQTLRHRLDELDGRLLVAMASPVGITVWDMAGGQDSIVPLPEAPAGPGLVVVGDRLVYVGATSAWSVTENGESRAIGRADQVLASGTADAVWLGHGVDDVSPITYFNWSEVDQDGQTLRVTRREMPMEFQTPDLVWGFNSSLFRLTDNTDRPWRLLSYGLPVAVGQNDLIVKACDPECRRIWFDTGTGDDRGLLLADVSTSFGGQGGWLSPDGRFLAHQEGSAAAVEIFSLGLGGRYTSDCLSARDVIWGDFGFMACTSNAGVSVVDLESGGSMSLVPPANLYGLAIWITE